MASAPVLLSTKICAHYCTHKTVAKQLHTRLVRTADCIASMGALDWYSLYSSGDLNLFELELDLVAEYAISYASIADRRSCNEFNSG